jgi:hypothetical protein
MAEADMVKKLRSLIPAAAIAFAVLFFGAPAKSDAQIAFQAQFATPIGTFGVAHGPAPYYGGGHYADSHGHGHGYRGRPYHGRYVHGYRPYWMKRVYVRAPYPRWVYQRVYYPYPYAYSRPYAYCP